MKFKRPSRSVKTRKGSRRYGKYRNRITRGYVKVRRPIRRRAALGNFPNQKTVALRYVETVTLDPSSSANAVQVFRVNNIYDPNQSGIGHQPMYRDNYAAIYDRYRVNYATITMVALNSSKVNVAYSNDVSGTTVSQGQFYAVNEKACRMFIIRDQSINDYNGKLDTMIEEGNTNLVWRYVPQNTSLRMPTLRMACWPHRLYNQERKIDAFYSTQTGGPLYEAYFICGVDQIGDGSDPDNMSFQFIITYNVTFSDLKKDQAQN